VAVCLVCKLHLLQEAVQRLEIAGQEVTIGLTIAIVVQRSLATRHKTGE